MTILPAIDIKNGKCVRLLQGDFNQLTDYNLRSAETSGRVFRPWLQLFTCR